MSETLPTDNGAAIPEVSSSAAGSAIWCRASAAAAKIIHHPRWPRMADEAHALATKIIAQEMGGKSPMKIPQKYYKGRKHPVVATVGELKVCLNDLPDSLPIRATFGALPQVVVWNHGQPDMHMELAQGDDE